MSEQSQFNEDLPPAPADQDMLALIRKMQQQLVFLEKKIDLLINQSQARPFSEKYFSKPYRPPFSHSHRPDNRHVNRHDRDERDSNPRERDSAPGRRFEKRHDGEKRGFDQKKRPFSYRQKDHR